MATKTSHRRAHHRAIRSMEKRRNLAQVCPKCAHQVASFEHFSECTLGAQVPSQLRGSRR